MLPSILKYSLVTLLTLTGTSSTLVDAPREEYAQIWIEKVDTVPILQSWKAHFIEEDEDITKFVSKKISLKDTNYIPPDLIAIGGIEAINEAGRIGKLRLEARDALWKMAVEFEKQFSEPLVVISGYRSAEYQQRMWNLWKCTDTLCAPPGYSEHQLGLAVDLFDATTETEYYKNAQYRKYIAWLTLHAAEYGYSQSYQKWEYIDAYEVEPWHWRYLWVDLATKLHKLDMTYTEYVRFEWVLDRME